MADPTKPSTHWKCAEIDRLGTCWCNVSTEKGGPGAAQRRDGMWRKIGEKYHEQNPPPPVPTDKDGRICCARNVDSLITKWKRMKPFIMLYMKCDMMVTANPKSGEDQQGMEDRAMLAYRRENKGKEFPFLSLYKILKVEPKWQLDVEQHKETARQRAGLASQATIQARIERIAERQPTVAGTKKPEGVKRARKTMAELVGKNKEEQATEDELSAYLAAFTQKEQLGRTVLKEGSRRTDALARSARNDQEANDDNLMRTDTTGMDEESIAYFKIKKRRCVERLLEQDRQDVMDKEVARIAAVFAAAAEVEAEVAATLASAHVPIALSDEEDFGGEESVPRTEEGGTGTEGEVEKRPNGSDESDAE